MYNMPFNMNTFSKMWNISTPAQAKAIIEEQKKEIQGEPKNLEEQAISLVGREIYEKLVKGEAVGQRLQGASFLYHPPSAGALYL